MNINDQVAFVKAMCESGESARFGHRPHAVAEEEFAKLLAEHAQRQFQESRQMLGHVKRSLRSFAAGVLVTQVNQELGEGMLRGAKANWVGQWEWSIGLKLSSKPWIRLEFGPTLVSRSVVSPELFVAPDYTKIHVVGNLHTSDHLDVAQETDVGLDEVVAGLSPDDTRIRDAVLAIRRQA